MAITPIKPSVTGVITNRQKIPQLTTGNKKSDISNDTYTKNSMTVKDISNRYDVTSISPREMANMSYELYDSGMISFQQHALLSFQPELSPYFDSTIGQHTNLVAQPDVPRNFLGEWEKRLAEQLTQNVSGEAIQNTKEIVSILANINTLRSG